MDPFASRVKVISPFFWNLETESLRSLSYLLRLTRLLRYFLPRVSSHEARKIERRAIKSNAKNRPSFPRNSHPFSLSSTPRANIPFVTCPLLRRKQSETVEGTEEGRDRKGLVAKVTVPTDSSRKANSREANKPANSFLVCVAYVLPSSSTTCTLHPLPPLRPAHTNEKRRGCVGRRARARTCNSVKRSRYVSRAPVFNVYVSMCMCTHACTHVRAARIYTRVYGEVWWLLGCLPRLSGALPARTLNPARLNLGIIRGYNQPSLPSSPPPSPPPHRLLLTTPPPPPPPPPSLPCLPSRSRVLEKRCANTRTNLRALSLSALAVTSSFFLRLAPLLPPIFRWPEERKGVEREPPHLPRARTFSRGRRTHLHRDPLLQLLLRTHGKHFCR